MGDDGRGVRLGGCVDIANSDATLGDLGTRLSNSFCGFLNLVAMEVLLNRRSTRQFTDEPVSEADINDLLRAAMQAPSAGNQVFIFWYNA